jgi:hypothetical protein
MAQGVGFQGGVSIDPDQIYVGSHFETRALIDRLHFRPGIEGGFGDDITLAAINVDFLYKFEIEGTGWTIYQGGGPAVNIYRFEDQNEVDGGLNVIFGFGHESGFFAEFKVGTNGSPDLKFGAGFTIRTN